MGGNGRAACFVIILSHFEACPKFIQLTALVLKLTNELVYLLLAKHFGNCKLTLHCLRLSNILSFLQDYLPPKGFSDCF